MSLVDADARATAAREAVHACELDINPAAQQIEFNRQQIEALGVRGDGGSRSNWTRWRRGASRAGWRLSSGRTAAAKAQQDQQTAAAELEQIEREYGDENRRIEGLEADVEAARSEVFSALERRDHAAPCHPARRRGGGARVARSWRNSTSKTADVRMERERLEGDRAATADGLRRAQQAAEASMHARTARETELATARIELEWRSNSLQARERELAGLSARLASLTELEDARAGYTEAARMVLAQANGHVGQQGSVADYLEVEPKYERAVEACLGDLLQHVIVPTHKQAEAGLELIRQENVGRCGFVVLEGVPRPGRRAGLGHRPLHGLVSDPRRHQR